MCNYSKLKEDSWGYFENDFYYLNGKDRLNQKIYFERLKGLERYSSLKIRPDLPKHSNLTTLLDYAKKGLSNEEIADMIYISRHTAKAHISSIIRKLHAKNRINALYIAIKKGLIK